MYRILISLSLLLLSTLCLFKTSNAAEIGLGRAGDTLLPDEEVTGEEGNNVMKTSNPNPPDYTEWEPPQPAPGGTVLYSVITKPWLNMNDAKTYCERMSTYHTLCGIETESEFNFIQKQLDNFLTANTRYNRLAFWLSGTDLMKNSTAGYMGQHWYYSGVPINRTFWGGADGQGSVQPDDYEWETRGVETCVDMKVPNNGTKFCLNDEVCTTQASFICEKKNVERLNANNA